MNQYITNNKPNENLIYVLDYLGISVDEFLGMSDEKIISIYKRSADSLNDGVMTKGGSGKVYKDEYDNKNSWKNTSKEIQVTSFADSGSKSRYFDIDCWAEKHGLLQFPKASKRERNEGCEGLPTKTAMELTGRKEGSKGLSGSEEHGNSTNPFSNSGSVLPRSNHHPTVKPVHLMSWLVRLVSKEGDTVLDPFMGSGTTGVACKKLNRNFIGIEIEEEYIKIAEARLWDSSQQITFV